MGDKGFRSGFMTAVFMFIGIAVVFLVGKSVMPSVGEAFVLESIPEFSESASDNTGSAAESSTMSSVSSAPVSSLPVISSSSSSFSSATEAPPENSAGTADGSPEMQSIVSSETASVSSEPPVSLSESTAEQSTVSQPESSSSASEQESSAPPVSESGIININTATAHELQGLNGIGEVKARAIIDYRVQNGVFSSVDELINVKGIGEKTLEKIRADITV